MSEEIDDLRSEIRNYNEEKEHETEQKIETLTKITQSLFRFIMTGEPDEMFTDLMAVENKFFSSEVWALNVADRVSFLEMKVGRRVAEEDTSVSAAVTPPIYVVKDIMDVSQVREYIRANEYHLTDEQAYEIQTRIGLMIEPPRRSEPSKVTNVELAQGVCDECGHSITEHAPKARGYAQECTGVKFKGVDSIGGHCGCKKKFPGKGLPGWTAEDEYITRMSQVRCSRCDHVGHRHHAKGTACEEVDCPCRKFITAMTTTAEQSNQGEIRTEALNSASDEVWELIERHSRFMNGAELNEFTERIHSRLYAVAREKLAKNATTAAQSESYSKSSQSELSPQYEERQSSSHFQCKFRHGQTVVAQLAHMESTSGSNHQAMLAVEKERFSRTLLALYSCEEVECQAVRTLVVQVLSNRLLG